jgi:hypothetical protein
MDADASANARALNPKVRIDLIMMYILSLVVFCLFSGYAFRELNMVCLCWRYRDKAGGCRGGILHCAARQV